jgi:hypothetical protein
MTPSDYNLNEAAYSVCDFAKKCSVGRNLIYNSINSGELKTILIGARRVITAPAGAAWLNSLNGAKQKFAPGGYKGPPRAPKEAAAG